MKPFLIGMVLVSTMFAQEPCDIYKKKCQMCHSMYEPHSKKMKEKLVAPSIGKIVRNIVVNLSKINHTNDEKELKNLAANYIQYYSFNTSNKKGYSSLYTYKVYGVMPNLKGFIKDADLKAVSKWIIDNYMPSKNKYGRYE